MFCKYCGNQIPNDSSFCKYCGNQLAKSATTQTTAQSPNKEKATTSNGTGFAKFLIFALFCFIAYIVYYTNSTELENFSSGGNVQQRTYIENTYEAFAAASVGDWYIDINDGNRPKQVTQGDIDWSRQKLREQGKSVQSKKSTTTAKTATASTKANVATTKTETSTSTAATNNFTSNAPLDKPTPKTKTEVDKEIRRTLNIVQKHVADFTGDGKKNCMDYTLLFFYAWNVLATKKDFEECDIVINKHGTFNHAFICIYYYDSKMNKKSMYIEPQTRDGLSYSMSEAWGSRYNSKYNEVATTWYIESFGLPKVSLTRYYHGK